MKACITYPMKFWIQNGISNQCESVTFWQMHEILQFSWEVFSMQKIQILLNWISWSGINGEKNSKGLMLWWWLLLAAFYCVVKIKIDWKSFWNNANCICIFDVIIWQFKTSWLKDWKKYHFLKKALCFVLVSATA